MVTPIQLLLFGARRVHYRDGQILLDDWITLNMDPDVAAAIVALRVCLDAFLIQSCREPTSILEPSERNLELVKIIESLSTIDAWQHGAEQATSGYCTYFLCLIFVSEKRSSVVFFLHRPYSPRPRSGASGGRFRGASNAIPPSANLMSTYPGNSDLQSYDISFSRGTGIGGPPPPKRARGGGRGWSPRRGRGGGGRYWNNGGGDQW